MEQRENPVWQRVWNGQMPEGGDIRPLLLTAAESLAVYSQLAQTLTGKQRATAAGLRDMARRSLEALKGIQSLSGHPAGNLRTPPVPKEPARRLLEKSYHRALRQMTEYTARSLDPEFGVVYQSLGDRERTAAVLLAQLIGAAEA